MPDNKLELIVEVDVDRANASTPDLSLKYINGSRPYLPGSEISTVAYTRQWNS